MDKSFFTRGIGVLALLVLLAGCAEPLSKREKGALIGGGAGAGIGAIIGAAVGNPAAGAAIGGALGGVGGAVVGDQLQARDKVADEQQQQIEAQQQELARNRQLLEELKKGGLEARETERGVVVNLPDVLFQFGRAELTGDARGKVRDIADVLNRQAKGRRVSIEGHTDAIGSDAANQQLSQRRAESVAGSLESSGVSSQRIKTKGYGERYPVAPNNTPDGDDNPSGRAKNRRVEVVIEN